MAVYTAANYAVDDDSFTQAFIKQNQSQFWLPEEISLTPDLLTWKSLTKEEQTAYMRVLGGLTLLDTEQGVGIPRLIPHIKGHQRQALLTFMSAMENSVHAKSYSNIFLTLASREEIAEVFDWVRDNPYLQRKADVIVSHYKSVKDSDDISLFKALVSSVFLESFLFYSGFYYPLYMYGQGRLMQSGEIINLIIRDESIHGVYIGLLAQEIFNRQTDEIQDEIRDWVYSTLETLYQNEALYTADIYDPVGLTHDVLNFVQYNANKALANLGFDALYEHSPVNPIVLNGLSTKTKSHDFFSMKGNGYKKATVEQIQDSDFYFE
ncbi:class 1b ribonucleoside-diphosphate reductase subunit beta [Lysinibacillus sp. NPDC093712]|uniref:class 1b ribonucleoside-diphosphate reductase subunit beta n=1 Tax=Lysinibacillus sp. NPDC093712 TaxID=3390579 RepID=UPI003D02E6EA